MKQFEVAKNLLADKSCDTCCRSGIECGEHTQDIETNFTCKSWESLSVAAAQRKAAEKRLIAKWRVMTEEEMKSLGLG